MAKFNTPATRPAVSSPIVTERMASATTFEGGAGYARDAKSELFLLAVTNMVAEHTFYEKASDRDDRYERIVRQVAVEDPDWTLRFLRWLRSEANMRTAALVGAALAVHARLADQAGEVIEPTNRATIAAVLQRADEPGELLAYWVATFGKAVPKPVKRGVADAVRQLYTERNLLKYDTDARGWRFGDVLEFVHAKPRADWQGELFRHAIDRRHGRGDEIPPSLRMLCQRTALMAMSVGERHTSLAVPGTADVLRDAGMTWEALAGWLQAPMDAHAWEVIIPSMGYMALLRNLRNFDEAGVSDEVAQAVASRLADPAEVAKSRQFPMRFLSAYRAAPSLRWSWALERAITASLATVPRLAGRTLILVDTSTSMNSAFSKDGTLMRWDAAAVFGIALGARCAHADVVSFSSAQRYFTDPAGANTRRFDLSGGESLLRAVDRWRSGGYFLGGGTDTPAAIRRHLRPGFHDRIVILTDEQAGRGGVDAMVPREVPLYTWNLAGYQHGHAPSGCRNRHTFGGLTDQAFRMIPLLESGRNGTWPF